jgi:predicted ATP-grasp superfamily ATP-dependent carboligase
VIEVEGLRDLNEPLMIAAFEGWNDAAEAATGVVEHLMDVYDAQPLAEFDPEDYYDFQVNRPTISWGDGGVRDLTWPTTRLYTARLPNGRDLVLVRGVEPSMRWRTFTSELVGLAFELDIDTVIALGALLADTPHTRPVPVTGVASDPGTARALGLEPSRYEGPTGIVGVFTDALARAGLSTLSYWAAVPHYASHAPCPKATVALLARVEETLGIAIPLEDLEAEAKSWELSVDELAAEDLEVAEYVKTLEDARDTADLPEASGDAIAQEFERYLRRRDDGPQQPPKP